VEVNRAQLERTVESLKAENAALKLRLENRTAQVDLLLQQIDDIKQLLAEHGLEMTYGMDQVDGR
jgi:prefoldin subunit 5